MNRSAFKIVQAAAIIWLCAAAPAHSLPGRGKTDPAIAPHKALYKIAMVSKKSSSQIVNVHGRMYFEWNAGCDAWTTDHRFRLYYDYADSTPLRIDSSFSTYEPYDGKSLSFNSRRTRNGELFQELSGRATMDGSGGTAYYIVPKGMDFTLPPGTLFPMLHTVDIVKQALAGQRFFNAVVFDGSDDEGPVEINTFIGRRIDALDFVKPAPHIDKALLDVPAWKIRMAFFPTLLPDTDPEYEMDAILQENGVISDMRVEYKDFTVTQTLVALEPLQAAPCGPETPAVAPPAPPPAKP